MAAIPAKRGVFLLEDSAGQAVLLTTAADIRARLRFRLSPPPQEGVPTKRIDLRELAARIRWKLADSHFETDWQFLLLARQVYPRTYEDLLSYKSAWFVRADAGAKFPSLSVVADVREGPVEHFGPFLNRSVAGQFIEIIQDGFDLCRYEHILRRAPNGTRCVYGQIGRSPAACAGGESLDSYRARFVAACRYAAGQRDPARRELEGRMRHLAAQTEFEQAKLLKARLASLKRLEDRDFQQAAPIEHFQYVLIQRGPSAARAKAFLIDRGAVAPAGLLDFPVAGDRAAELLDKMRQHTSGPRTIHKPQREQLALVTHYLFAGPEKAGLALRYDSELTADKLAAAVTAAADRLKLKPPARKGRETASKQGHRAPNG